jgi:5-methylcytosine-specific restriction enzyme A
MRHMDRDRLYGRAWRKARVGHLRQHPLCIMCKHQGKVCSATVVDHITPHRGDHALFWNPNNWQSLCQPHHDSTKQREEKGNPLIGTDINGRPTHPDHPWNKK